MEEGKLKRKKISAETTVEILFFLFLLVFYLMWARVQPMGAGPDEQMRYHIADYIYKHGSLPVGDDPSVRNVVWGISYAFSPILSYMIAAVFMKAVSFVTTAPFALLLAARFVNILFGLGTVWLVLDMGKRLFDRRKAWIAAAFVGLLPGSLFVFTYVNCDALAVFSTAVIVYAWVRYLDEGWIYKNCVILALGVAACALSYYNAYGFILCSIFFFGITLFMEAKKKGKYTDFVKKGLLVCVIVLLLAASGEDFCNPCEKTVECESDFQLVHAGCDDHSEYIECILFLCIGLSATGTLQSSNDRAAYVFHGNGIWKSF